MWTWKHSLALALTYMMVVSLFVEIRRKLQSPEEIILDCFDPGVDGSVTCHFTKKINANGNVCVTMIHPTGNFTSDSIRSWANVGIHRLNMPIYMPENLGKHFTNLEELYITQSSLKFIFRRNFQHMKRLHVLDLDSNEIEVIPNDTFHDLHNLVYLKINGNKLKELYPPILNHLHKLHTFSAYKNEISRIDVNFFDHNFYLRWIYLAGNKIDDLQVDFSTIKYIRAVDLRKNRGGCNFLFNINFNKKSTIENFQQNVTKFCVK